jgi:hypothetical protein
VVRLVEGDGVVCGGMYVCGCMCFVQHNQSLQTLNLEENSIGAEGAKALAEALKVASG